MHFFFSDVCVIQDLLTRKLIGVGSQYDGLYYLNPGQRVPMTHATTSKVTRTFWHQRMGHASYQRLSIITTMFSSCNSANKDLCDVCHLSKQIRLPFPCSGNKTNFCFELIHCDIWGP